nr:pantetheine-phosphate adenylyltransferase [Gammaproteobacteria bacterium]NIR97371.1 pantetheine-phosphate adenylyltransferase [Gammaproteobacteria bacterium]NIT63028.1 pantetheine-phosphate adenylyltransferase [Gammaproteobacteria bacterium]NIV21158.1 pantetheine-phosphate adenylyltransferase [Gammaproteobacteria bacterium]NIY31608.1 pantetheine-phosphate adenylyltransferase [Gammaproteobacteria bacterium]
MHALYPISGNPPTWGHADVMARAARVFERLTWALAINPTKPYECPQDVRLEMMRDYVRHLGLENVTVAAYQGATVRFAEQIGAGVIIKGLRNQMDLQAEMEQAFGNRGINDRIETLVLFTQPRNGAISSSLIRELALLGEDIDDYVLPSVAQRLREYLPR